MNIKTLKILQKYARLIAPGNKKFERACVKVFEDLDPKEKRGTIRELKVYIMMHDN